MAAGGFGVGGVQGVAVAAGTGVGSRVSVGEGGGGALHPQEARTRPSERKKASRFTVLLLDDEYKHICPRVKMRACWAMSQVLGGST